MKLLSNLFFILCLPSILLHPVPLSAFQTPISSQEKMWDVPLDAEGKVNPWLLLNTDTPSIDRYFAFIDLICDETFLETLSEEELSRVVAFATAMVRASAPKREQELIDTYEQEILELMDELYAPPEWKVATNHPIDFHYTPNTLLSDTLANIALCKKNWIQRGVHSVGKWCSKHKKPLIAGAVVVTVVAIAVATGGIGGSSAAAVGGALINDTCNDKEPCQHINKPGEVYLDDPIKEPSRQGAYPPPLEPRPPLHSHNTPLKQTYPLQKPDQAPIEPPSSFEQLHALTFEKVEEAKEVIFDQTQTIPPAAEKNYIEQIKDVAKTAISDATHSIFENVSKIGTAWHEYSPQSTPEDLQKYEAFVASQHEKIDGFFGTSRPDYSLEGKELSMHQKALTNEIIGEMQYGALPPPAALVGAASRAATIASKTLDIAKKSEVAIAGAVAGSMLTQQTSSTPLPEEWIKNRTNINQLELEHHIRSELALDGYHPPQRPQGVPKHWDVAASDKKEGIKYYLEITKKNGDPYNKEEVRVMPAKPNPGYEGHSRPYVTHRIQDDYYDKDGNIVPKDSLEAHIHPDEYDFEKISNTAKGAAYAR